LQGNDRQPGREGLGRAFRRGLDQRNAEPEQRRAARKKFGVAEDEKRR
jgi:hypothetical protein